MARGRIYQLDPLLRESHINGGECSGPVKISIAHGFAGIIGKRMAIGLVLSINKGGHALGVSITHGDDGLHREWVHRTLSLSILKRICALTRLAVQSMRHEENHVTG